MSKPYARNPRAQLRNCAHCGLLCGDPAGGLAWLSRAGGIYVCHPNAPGRPDCYRRIFVYGELVGVLKSVDPKPGGIEDLLISAEDVDAATWPQRAAAKREKGLNRGA